ncbi:hypothetical protein CTI14_07735 [Methylobacterium radiotolerans]|nr:hypothetical protein CTI14_07735 [Methylobacterium radiotolerans]
MTADYARGSPGVLCVLYLEQAADEAERAIQDPQRWFFAIPQMYQALGSILVAALAGSASFGAYTDKVQREWMAYFDLPDYPDHPPPEGEFMQPISALMRRVQDGSEPEMQGRPVVLSADQKKDLVRLSFYRGQMEHVRPGSWSLATGELPRILAAAAEVIRQLLEQRRCCTDLEEEAEARSIDAVRKIKALATEIDEL